MLIICKIIIGYGLLNKCNLYDCYGVLLGEVEIKVVCEFLNWEYELFEIFVDIYVVWDVKVKGVEEE